MVTFFYSFYNLDSESYGGPISISTGNVFQEQTKNPVKIYYSDFQDCFAVNGGSIYIESAEISCLFDIFKCTFCYNTYKNCATSENKRSSIFIQSSTASFSIKRCSFDKANVPTKNSKMLLEESTDENKHGLKVEECKFTNSHAKTSGGSICILIRNQENHKPIDISKCILISNTARNTEGTKSIQSEYGGAIYYDFSPETDTETSSKSLLADPETYDEFSYRISECGGGISISTIQTSNMKSIMIVGCQFHTNKADNNAKAEESVKGTGADIYYHIKSLSSGSTQIIEESKTLVIRSCEFVNSESREEGGSVHLVVSNKEKGKIEITQNKFKHCSSKNGDSLCIRSTNSESKIDINGCEFQSYDFL